MSVAESAHASPAATYDELVVIEPHSGWRLIDTAELWRYRDLLYFMIWRDIKVRYKQSVLGIGWVVFQPLVQMVAFTLVVGLMFGMEAPDGVPYPLFNFAALIPWTYFSQGVTRASGSLVQGSNLIKKVYFPRLIMPLAGVLSGLIDLAIALAILFVLALAFHLSPALTLGNMALPDFSWSPGWEMLWLPPFVLLASLTAIGLGLWASALMVQFRDVALILPFFVQTAMYACPVLYPSSEVPQSWHWVYFMNPMAGVVDGFRWAVLGGLRPDFSMLGVSTAVALVVCITGLLVFRRMEQTFADVV
jgi:lipopolysaccharide transport system permease protein